ncbi:MupA/Atu3671 family FMN-dependent luciferase-like monooxygenase [Roseovarius dicentrarchi]|uniref:MupA/Atu3671 family FMN-dependent luciferase-like monooxygenase n=1 Tax=Roseovarius dicentrarchi TaxID=2250573 RepID=UPI000DEAD84D|nr:MupA/Atu3671 family FMN-dependent luciferase-like monooxygenase [Roseovarius dicentrarchi]
MSLFSCILIGDETLTVTCAEMLMDGGAQIGAVATRDSAVRDWAGARGVPVVQRMADLVPFGPADWVLSIANLRIVPQAVLDLAVRGAVNFHDGPLPDYAGLNAPVHALLDGAARHGITWHYMTGGIDEGDILLQRRFDIPVGATAHTLNARCYAEAMDSFGEVMTQLASGSPARMPQGAGTGRYYGRADLPEGAGYVDFTASVQAILRYIRALDFAGYANPLTTAKLRIEGVPVAIGRAEPATGQGAPGQIVGLSADWLCVMGADGAVRLSGLRRMTGGAPDLGGVAAGHMLARPAPDAIRAELAALAPHEDHWRRVLADLAPLDVPLARRSGAAPDWQARDLEVPGGMTRSDQLAGICRWAERSAGVGPGDLAYAPAALNSRAGRAPGDIAPWVPVRSDASAASVAAAAAHHGFAADLALRDPALAAVQMPQVGVADGTAPIPGTVVCVLPEVGRLMFDASRLDDAAADLLAARLGDLLRTPDATLPDADATRLAGWAGPQVDLACAPTLAAAFEAQVRRTPDADALVFEAETLSYAALNARANAVAAALQAAGVRPGVRAALCMTRGPGMMIGALGILKAGGAYVPLDSDYPAARLSHAITDSGATVLLTERALADLIHGTDATPLLIEDIPGTHDEDIDGGAGPDDLAYLIYTSGSTGTPKGVMVTHRNVANFSAGMDAHIDRAAGGVWLAVTSLAFDISVLELFHTLSRGFKVVLMGGQTRAAVSGTSALRGGRGVEFGLYYWGNDGGASGGKYHLLLEGAKFADAHGFTSLWTPERHFHAFGGPYPNPAVTGAAVASITQNLDVRAGSCVAPLHHPARIAEEWAVIDNLTGGRAGIAFASGWQPDDFVLRPENTPPANKPALYQTMAQVRALWRGEEVGFPRADGTEHRVLTQPRPINGELPIWLTTAGNPDTWREAGTLGAHVLTHLLGQTIEEVEGKIAIYHDALRAAGHDPADFKVTMMLHSYIADTREAAREVAREPMKDYLRSAAGLIKQYAWAFPAFKKPAGVADPAQIDLGSLEEEELDAILDFAFQRYFEDAGLFGTVEDGVARAHQLAAIGVTEIACLIDYGIDADTVLEGLRPLAEVLRRANAPDVLDADDFSLAAQILRHGATHLQCTPSMARLIAMNAEARSALGHIRHLYLGGEALPGDLLADLRRATPARICNMYGPTETTIWSTVQPAQGAGGATVPIGAPIANTVCHVLDDSGAPVPIGAPGTLWIGGAGVAPGYWNRKDLTAERFRKIPGLAGGTLYNTGDLAAWRPNGSLEFIGRADAQVKIRGQRIELGEIEACISGFDGITGAVVTAAAREGGDVRLAGYFTGANAVDITALRDHLSRHLPGAMVPAHLMRMDVFPLTPNKKIDRAALLDPVPAPRAAPPAPSKAAPAPVSANAAPGDLVATLARIWSGILGVEQVGVQDNFFALGGHSLLAVQAHRDIRAALPDMRLSITDIFRFPVLGDLAAHLGHVAPTAASPAAVADGARSETISRRRAMRAGRTERAQ